MLKNCVVRTYSNGYTNKMVSLEDKLNNGWTVKFITPFYFKGNTEYVEYILEKECN